MRVAIPVFPGVEELDAIAPLEVFGIARNAGLDVTVGLVTHLQDRSIRAFHGLEMLVQERLSGEDVYDVIVVPGGAWLAGDTSGVRFAIGEGILPGLLKEQFDKGAVVASVCTGAFLLAAAGLFDGIPATTHHLALKDLETAGVRTVVARVVDAGRILSAGGIASGLDLSLRILERSFGKEAADHVAGILEYKRQGGVFCYP